MVLAKLFAGLPLLALGGTFKKIGSNPGSTEIQVNGVGAGAFDPKRISNWQRDARFPLISPQNQGSCPGNIYNPSVVNNGPGTWNIYFGGWDGVSSCHDSVSVVVTENNFSTLNPHAPMIATGSAIHVNNPSAIRASTNKWLMVTTQLQALNKPSIAVSSTGVDWSPNQGGVPEAAIQVSGYDNWATADVNGGNVIIFDNNALHLFFDDFTKESQHAVYHAVSQGDLHNFQYTNVALDEPNKVCNDLKLINGQYLMGLHFNGPQVYYSVSSSLSQTFPPASVLFNHDEAADQFIVSVGFVVDDTGSRLLGALYGAGAVPQLDENRIFARWLVRRVIFANNDTLWGAGDQTSFGPDTSFIATNAQQLTGNFYIYDTDYVDPSNRGTLLATSPVVTVTAGDIWQYYE